MRKLGMVVLVVCLLGTVPVRVTAAETQGGGGWWDGVVAWVLSVLVPQVEEASPPAGQREGDMGPGVEPDGISLQSSDPNS